ncbi:MAG: glycoside hydrolase family 3 N-terminal domain-containing protein [Gaiellales bacterium]|jgi:beta-N-acetylhexosaminidase|nr:glycoside hydrolase family 3 N-terminal domain-containing protein [Gaiellales bacterium]
MHRSAPYPARWTRTVFAIAVLLALPGCTAFGGGGGSGSSAGPLPAAPGSDAPRPPTPSELVGQRLVVRMNGDAPSPALLGRIRRGELGGVILFAANIRSPGRLRALVARLQGAAAAAGRPPLLIAVDQEGGAVRRLTWAPPALSAAAMAGDGVDAARRQGRATGKGLAAAGINVDLAPVADVVRGRSFLRASGRSWGDDPHDVAALATAFALGLGDAGVIATVKHFPGLGRARQTTDRAVVEIGAGRSPLGDDLLPFRAAIDAGVPMVMLSNASYPAYGRFPAGWEPAIARRLLRGRLGFEGVSITDSLDGAAHARGITPVPLALRAAAAGVDLLLITGSEATSRAVFSTLRRAARDGLLDHRGLEQSYRRIQLLKQRIGD